MRWQKKTQYDNSVTAVDNRQIPEISGTYTCDREGNYEIDPYRSGVASGFSFTFSGLESGVGDVTYYNPQPLGNCGLLIKFPVGYDTDYLNWVIEIPNSQSTNYIANKNAYDLAIATRDQVLKQLAANLGQNGSSDANIAQAAVDAATGAYQAAVAAYHNTLIQSPVDGVVTFVDSNLKPGQSVNAGKAVITITKN